jgi:glucose-1-phosphate thymidylyltransferase
MLPVGGAEGTGQPVIGHLLGHMQQAGVQAVTVVIRDGKLDIRQYLAGNEWRQLSFDLRSTKGTSGVPETVSIGLEGNERTNIAFGFPDILYSPANALGLMMDKLDTGQSEVVLGLFPTSNPAKMDMVDTGKDGKVIEIEIKPKSTRLDLTWILAVWTPTFTEYLSNLLRNDERRMADLSGSRSDFHLGQVFKLAIADGLAIDSLAFRDGRSLDIGTPDDLALAQEWVNQGNQPV